MNLKILPCHGTPTITFNKLFLIRSCRRLSVTCKELEISNKRHSFLSHPIGVVYLILKKQAVDIPLIGVIYPAAVINMPYINTLGFLSLVDNKHNTIIDNTAYSIYKCISS